MSCENLPGSEQIVSLLSLENALLDRLADRPTPSAIFDVLRVVELKLDTDDIPILPRVGIFHDTG
mgnify:CR=1 FL=1